MVREYNGDVYVIAVRVTEPEGEWKEVHEPETITFELNTGINVPAAYDELQKYRWNYVKLNATEGQKDFSCTVPEGGIVPNSVIVAGVIDNAASKGYPDTLVDQFTKKVYPTALNLVGNLKYGYDNGNGNIEPRYTGTKGVSGTVNYSTGQIQFSFTNGIPAGSGFVQVAYAPANREARAIPIVGGVIHDELERNAVKIYRILLSSGINEKENSPERCKLSQNYPNPFISSTKITFTLNKSEHASLIIYDIVGHEIATLMDEYKEAGTHTVEWNGTNSKGQQMVSGVYFYQLRTSNGFTNTRKLLLLK